MEFWTWLTSSWKWLLLLYIGKLILGWALRWQQRRNIRHWILARWPELSTERKLIVIRVRECISEGTARLQTGEVAPEELETWFERSLSNAMSTDAPWSLLLLQSQILAQLVDEDLLRRDEQARREGRHREYYPDE